MYKAKADPRLMYSSENLDVIIKWEREKYCIYDHAKQWNKVDNQKKKNNETKKILQKIQTVR